MVGRCSAAAITARIYWETSMARQKIQFQGILPAMVTPMHADGSVDEASGVKTAGA